MNAGELKARTKVFAHRCIRLCSVLPESYLANHIKKQLLRCSTSVAANYRAACLAQSKGDFAAKLSIAIEEADESAFWMELIVDNKLFESEKLGTLIKEAGELTAIFIASRKSIKDRSYEFTGS